MMKEFVFDPADRQLTVKAYGREFRITANSAKNQGYIRSCTETLNKHDASPTEKAAGVAEAVDGILGDGVSAEFFGNIEVCSYDELMAFYNFLVNTMVDHSIEVQKKYAPERISEKGKN